MVEEKVGFLCSLSTHLDDFNDYNETLLKSYYLMRCKDLSRGFGLPEKHFSTKTRCPHCCTVWKNFSHAKLKPMKLSKKQIHRIKSRKQSNEENSKNELLHSNQLELVCSLCKHKTTTMCTKPDQGFLKTSRITASYDSKEENNAKDETLNKMHKPFINKHKKNKKQIDVYSNTKDIFYLQNNKNSIPSSIKIEPKIIKNNKKKKDKFAGLCKQAVLTVSQQKKDKLSLFLKPSAS